jgi:hypothetical protein
MSLLEEFTAIDPKSLQTRIMKAAKISERYTSRRIIRNAVSSRQYVRYQFPNKIILSYQTV